MDTGGHLQRDMYSVHRLRGANMVKQLSSLMAMVNHQQRMWYIKDELKGKLG